MLIIKSGSVVISPEKIGFGSAFCSCSELKINCKKGINKTKERRLKKVKSKFPIIVKKASFLYLKE